MEVKSFMVIDSFELDELIRKHVYPDWERGGYQMEVESSNDVYHLEDVDFIMDYFNDGADFLARSTTAIAHLINQGILPRNYNLLVNVSW